MAAWPGGSSRVGGSLSLLRREVADYLTQIGEAGEEARPPRCQHALPVLALYNRLRAWKCLPVGGGYFDQPALLMSFLEQIRLAYADYRETQEINRRLGEGEDSSRPKEQASTLTVKIPLPFDSE